MYLFGHVLQFAYQVFKTAPLLLIFHPMASQIFKVSTANIVLVETCRMYIWVFPKIGVRYPQIMHFNRVFHYKPSILGYPYFWKHPYSSTAYVVLLQCHEGFLFFLSKHQTILDQVSHYVRLFANIKESYVYTDIRHTVVVI